MVRTEYSDGYRMAIKGAAAIAGMEQRSWVGLHDVFQAICELCPSAVSAVLGCDFMPPVRWGDPLCVGEDVPCVQARYSDGLGRVLSVNGGVMERVAEALDVTGGPVVIDPGHIVAAILLHVAGGACCAPVAEWLGVNGIPLSALRSICESFLTRERERLISRSCQLQWERISRRCDALRESLTSSVIGNGPLIEKIHDLFADRWMTPAARRPGPAVLMLLGPEGSGRRYIAEALGKALSRIDVIDRVEILDFADYARTGSSIYLRGLDRSYQGGGREGVLTGAVIRNPKTCFVIHNTEHGAAAPIAILREILTSGVATDVFLETKADFGSSVFVLVPGEAIPSAGILRMVGENAPVDRLAAAVSERLPNLRELLRRADAVLLTESSSAVEACVGIARALDAGFAGLSEIFGAAVSVDSRDALERLLCDSLPVLSVGEATRAAEAFVASIRKELVRRGPLPGGKPRIRVTVPDLPAMPGCTAEVRGNPDEHAQRRLSHALRLTYKPAFFCKADCLTVSLKCPAYVCEPDIGDCGYFRVRPADVSFDDLVGIDEPRRQIERSMAYLNGNISAGRCETGILLFGPPGTGKTAMAKAMAKASGLPFIYICASDLLKAGMGGGVVAVHDVFAAAERMKGVLFIDEIEALGTRDGNADPESVRVISAFLTEMDGFGERRFLVIGATNRVDGLDPALLRPGRLGVHIRLAELACPDDCGRLARIVYREAGIAEPDPRAVDAMARHIMGMTPAVARGFMDAVVRECGAEFDRKTMLDVYNTVVYGEAHSEGAPGSMRTYALAVHEAGHAVLEFHFGRTVVQASIRGRRDFRGFVQCERPNSPDISAADLRGSMMVALGGALAEELFEMRVEGAETDMRRAADLADRLVQLEPLDSEHILDEAFRECRRREILDSGIADCRELLRGLRSVIRRFADCLYEEITVPGERLEAIWHECRPATHREAVGKNRHDSQNREA